MESGPAATTAQHLARFEFGEGGTKVLMVEWCPGQAAAGAAAVEANTGAGADPAAEAADAGSADAAVNAGAESDARADVTSDASHRQQQPQQQQPNPPASAVDTDGWEVSWPGKSTFLPAKDTDDDEGGDSPRRRVFFLLPPDAAVPATITISRPGRPSLVVKPLPAIFPEALDAEAGARGVLHTIWAKRRLRELDREMDAEMRANAESVGLEMALAERNWIVENFLPPPPSTQPVPQHLHLNQEQPPASPRSPISGRLADKLKGLRLATSAADLVPSPTANTFTGFDGGRHALSPTGEDVAVSSFASIPRSTNVPRPTAPSRGAGMASLDAALSGNPESTAAAADTQDTEADLFALPISPRSPDMKKSPFSILHTG